MPEHALSREIDFGEWENPRWESKDTGRSILDRYERFRLEAEARGTFQDKFYGEIPVAAISAVKPVAHMSMNICDRTVTVMSAILSKIPSRIDCAEITSTQPAAITDTLSLNSKNISSLKAGDFDGLISLTGLSLYDNNLSTLPDDIFDELALLAKLDLRDNDLHRLPGGIFDELTLLILLFLDGNALVTLPEDIFEDLTELHLNSSRFRPFGLRLQGNPGAPFRPAVNASAELTVQPGTEVFIPGSVTGPWESFVRWTWTQVDGPDSDTPVSGASPLTGGDTAMPSFTAPMTGGELHFRLVATPAHEGTPTTAFGHATSDPDWITVRVDVATNVTEAPLAVDFDLLGNYPNPFNPSTTILLDLPETAAVSVDIFSILGQRIHREDFPSVIAGSSQSLSLKLSHLSSGSYVYRVTALMGKEIHHASGRMTLIKRNQYGIQSETQTHASVKTHNLT